MKTNRLIAAAMCILILMGALTGCKKETPVISAEPETINIGSQELLDHKNYLDFKESADIIVHVRVDEALTNKNSEITYDNEGKVVKAVSDREATVFKVYKNTTGKDIGNTIVISEFAGMSDDCKIYTHNYIEPMKKTMYIVFLKKVGDRYFVINEGSNMITVMEMIDEVNKSNIAYQFLFDYELENKTQLTESLISLDNAYSLPQFESIGEEEIIQTGMMELSVQRVNTGNDEELFYIISDNSNDNSLTVNLTNMDQSTFPVYYE